MAHTSSVTCFHQRPLTVFASPGRYVQGPGATHELGRELQRLGLSGRVLFVAGRTAQRDLQPVVIAFGGECSVAEINRLVAEARSSQAVALVGAGGGKASDTARAVADELNLPAIITPTLASTDSPCSALSVIYSEGGSVEGFRFYNRHPLLVLVDTQVVAHAVHNGITEVPGSHDVIPGESSHNEPFPVTAEALVAALKAADQLGRTLG